MNKLANLVRHASRVEKVWAQFTNTSDQLSHQIGGTQFGKKKKGYPFSSCQIAYPQFGDYVGKHVGHHVGQLVHLNVGHHVSHHVGRHVSHHGGHRNVVLTLCEVSETLTEWNPRV